MNEGRGFGLENPWMFVFTNVVVWVAVVSTIQSVLFDGELIGAVIEGTTGGFVCGIAIFYLRENDWF
ncbi:hypothetical protein SAMN06266787_11621 [Halorubrum ezzemoulense]|uniref:Uncharacterized protein n=1 Tax=Halorubrum ezzemoulense TaxID=337243 RepID=A0A238YQF3_HALEZ|nr:MULTISPECIES: hypothetical protein [Halorubrum]MDB2287168.1 hypothetical protein [Halorubrum ezzemoulense]TKX64103.1 hypothetical protein EXE47_12800 [Halorubrum sp. GN12_10-3_MGM]SNR73028.1 hypothetical protein SAMN06266787_11621 [Halorubrum ezzemoulense]